MPPTPPEPSSPPLSQASSAPPEHWNAYFRRLGNSGDDLDWGGQWVDPFIVPLRAAATRSVLDLGCGTGNDVLRLAREGFRVTGLDFSEEAARRGGEKARRAPAPARPARTAFVVADMGRRLPLGDGAFDAVMSNVAAHMFSDAVTRALFADVRRVLRPGGLFLFHVNALEDRPLRARRHRPVRELEPGWVLEEDGQTMRFFSREYLLELLGGWQAVRLEPVEIADRKTGEPFKRVWRGLAVTPDEDLPGREARR